MSTSTHVDELLDGLEQPEAERPVIVTVTTRYIAWADADRPTEQLQQDACELLGDHPVPLDSWAEVEDPTGYELRYHVYADTLGPPPAPVQGPWWECPRCGGIQAPGASYPRRHAVRCPEAAGGGR